MCIATTRPLPPHNVPSRHSVFSMRWKWDERGFRPHLCAYRLNKARRTSWGWWDEWDDTALQRQDSKFEPRRSEAEHAASRSRGLPSILNLYEWAGKLSIVSFKLECQSGGRTLDLRLSKQAVLSTTPGPAFKHGLASAGSIFLRSVFGWDSSDHRVECFMMFGSLGSCLPACFGCVIWIIFELFLRNTWEFCSLKMCIAFARYNVKRKPQYNASNTVKGSTV